MIRSTLAILSLVQSPDGPVPADSYADSATAQLVAEARAARERNERLVTWYRATAKQRLGVGIRALSRDRMLYRSEVVARITWRRDSISTVEIVGAREGVPIALRGDHVPEDLHDFAEDLVINPAEDFIRVVADESEGFVYPLRDGGEADYRFAAGDTTTITLPTGRPIRLVALHVTPRRSDWRLISGTFWYDIDTHGLVQAVFRPARPYEFQVDADADTREDVPSFVNPIGEVKFITLEYGFYEQRWWMPRYMGIDAVGTMGNWLNVPFRMERVYEDYEVEGGTPRPPGSTFRPAGTRRSRDSTERITDPDERQRIADSVSAAVRECIEQVRDVEGDRRRVRAEIRRCRRRHSADSVLTVVIPEDTVGLLTSPELGPPILAMGDLITEEEILGLRDAIGDLPARPWAPRLDLPRGVTAVLQHARYNRIEALSLGTSATLDLGPVELRGIGRIGLADLVPNAEVSLIRSSANARLGIGVFRRLAAANPDTRPFGVVNSFLALTAQRDDGEYYRTLGAEFTAENANSGWWSARAYLQRERPAFVETSASLPRVWSARNLFRPNIVADSADQVGGSLTFRGTRALSRSVALGGEVTVDGATGDFEHARAAATLRLFVTPPGPLAWAVTGAAGTSTGEVPVQQRFYLGGAATLRGYSGGAAAGTAFWRARAEVGNSFPAARITLFGDVGWAGDRADFGGEGTLAGAGLGASFFDGLVRLDLARALRSPTGWRFEFYLDGIL